MLLIAFIFLTINAFSQTLTKSIIAPQGGVDSAAEMTLEWTLGENFIETVSKTNKIYTQGFHQPYFKVENQISNDFIDDLFGIKISPNPVRSLLSVKISGEIGDLLKAYMFDTQGRLVKEFDADSVNNIGLLDVSNLPSGVYYLSIRNNKDTTLKSSKIIKY